MRRAESLAVVDVYRYALRCRVGRDLLERARARKAAKAVRLAAQRQQRAERRLVITKKLE
jgi:ribosomal protein L31E